jgi:DNA-binding IclR family transcriptional regulator
MQTRLLDKVDRILQAIDEHRALGLEHLHVLLGLPKPTLKRLLDDLEMLGWIYRRLGDRRYVTLAYPGRPSPPDIGLAKAVSPQLDELFAATGLASDLVILGSSGPTILESNYSRLGIRTARDTLIGARSCPHRSAAGRALLEGPRQDEERREGIFRREPGSWEHGFRKPFDIAAIAIPLQYQGQTRAALSLYWNARRHSEDEVLSDHLASLLAMGERLDPLLKTHRGVFS